MRQPSDHPISLTALLPARLSPLGVTCRFYLGELSDLLAHLAVHLVVVQLLFDVRELCRSPVNGGARPGGLCSLTGAWSHNKPPRELPRPVDSQKWSCRLSDENSHLNRVNFLLVHLIPLSVDHLPWTAARWKTFGSRSAGVSSCVPVVAPLSLCPPGDRGGHTLEVHRGRARANRPFPAVNR